MKATKFPRNAIFTLAGFILALNAASSVAAGLVNPDLSILLKAFKN